MYSEALKTNSQDVASCYLVNTPNETKICDTIEGVMAAIEPFVLEEALYTDNPDLLYEIPYLLDYSGYVKGRDWEVSLAPRL